MMITKEQLAQAIPTNKKVSQWYDATVELFPKYGLNTVNRIAGFIAQAAHESSEFNVLEENLNYSASNLQKTFGKYFTKETAAQYARKPEMIANRVYDDANRTNKLGNTQPGDGWKFRGRGLFQLTGRWNYEKFGKTVGMTAEQSADYMSTIKGALESALWYWKVNGLEKHADADNITAMSRAVNGGDNGLQERIQRYNKYKQLLDSTPPPFSVLGRGSRGPDVEKLQKALKLPVDGVFGIQVEAAVRSWQRSNKYEVTSKIDQLQFKKLVG